MMSNQQLQKAPQIEETKVDRALRQGSEAIKVLFLIMAFAYVALRWSDLSGWLSSITHGEVFGIKFDREAAKQKVEELASEKISLAGRDFAQGAIARAERVGSAVAGAHVLWLDTNVENNLTERQVLEAMGISVQRALSVADAKVLAEQAVSNQEPYDLIISNVDKNPSRDALTKCPVSFSQMPYGESTSGTLADYNVSQNNAPRQGFAFAEWLATNETTKNAYMEPQRSKLVFYSGSTGGIATTICARIITNYADILLQNVVSALEESRWAMLPSLPTQSKTKSAISERSEKSETKEESNTPQ
jgi:hypothetical protein